jgi:carbamoyltransferase
MANTFDETAQLMADGAVIGWVQGRTEYGPRALGNRSIIADPRLASHKDTINAMIKKREAYRPFAPSVPDSAVQDFFDIPDTQRSFPFMSCVLPVREQWRERLGAITHVDGSARLQTVSRAANPRYYQLIEAFGRKTGVPMLLNTSFNNNVEPIVNTVDEAVTCYITSGLNYLVAGDYLVTKEDVSPARLAHFDMWLSPCSQLVSTRAVDDDGVMAVRYELVRNYDATRRRVISEAAHRVIGESARGRLLSTALAAAGESADHAALMDELFSIWGDRFIVVRPASPTD